MLLFGLASLAFWKLVFFPFTAVWKFFFVWPYRALRGGRRAKTTVKVRIG